ncbi:MAG: AAA family ATPase [Nitrososphaerota archaeon]
MYELFYGMKKRAFENIIDAETFFLSPTHKEASDFILGLLNSSENYILILGEYGVGKTYLCNYIYANLSKDLYSSSVVIISHPNISYNGIISKICETVDPSLPSKATLDPHDSLINYFQSQSMDKQVTIIADDVQEMDANTLRNLLSLGKIVSNGKPVIRLILFAHPSFLKLLKYPVMEPYDQRIRRRYLLKPFDRIQTKEYIYFRMVKAGGRGIPIFDDNAIDTIYQYSKGIPRLINNICEISLEIAATLRATTITSSIIAEAIKTLDILPSHTAISPKPEEASEPTFGEIHPGSATVKLESLVTPSRLIKVSDEPDKDEYEKSSSTVITNSSAPSRDVEAERLDSPNKYRAYIVFSVIVLVLNIILLAILYFKR